MSLAISEEEDTQTAQTHPHLLPPSLAVRGTQGLGVPRVTEGGWVEMQLEVGLLGYASWETGVPLFLSLPFTDFSGSSPPRPWFSVAGLSSARVQAASP